MAVGLVNKFVFPKSNGDGLCVACGEIWFVIDGLRGVTVPFLYVLNRPFPVCVKGQFPVVRSSFRSGRVGLVVKLVLDGPYTEGVTGLFVGRKAVASKFVRCLLPWVGNQKKYSEDSNIFNRVVFPVSMLLDDKNIF